MLSTATSRFTRAVLLDAHDKALKAHLLAYYKRQLVAVPPPEAMQQRLKRSPDHPGILSVNSVYFTEDGGVLSRTSMTVLSAEELRELYQVGQAGEVHLMVPAHQHRCTHCDWIGVWDDHICPECGGSTKSNSPPQTREKLPAVNEYTVLQDCQAALRLGKPARVVVHHGRGKSVVYTGRQVGPFAKVVGLIQRIAVTPSTEVPCTAPTTMEPEGSATTASSTTKGAEVDEIIDEALAQTLDNLERFGEDR